MIEVSWVFDVAAQGLEEGYEDGSVAIAMVARAHSSHHVCDLDLVTIISVHEWTLLNLTEAHKRHLVHDRAKRCKSHRQAQASNVRDNNVAE